MADLDGDDRLIGRMRRMVAAAGTMTARDERQRLLVIESDIRMLRESLQRKADQLATQINAASAQVNAVTAYARCASLRHGSPQDRNTTKQRSN